MLPYSEEDICLIYRRAKNKRKQIQILAEMNLTGKDEIIKVLDKYGLRKECLGQAQTCSRTKNYVYDNIFNRYKEAAENGLTCSEAAKLLGVSADHARRYAKRHYLVFREEKAAR